MRRKAFTLIELLVVIAIIAILAVVVVLTLNPAELLRQSRDSNRVSDIATLSDALNLYVTDQSSASTFSLGNASNTYPSTYDPGATSTLGDQCQNLGFPSLTTSTGQAWQCAPSSTYRTVNSTGWIPVNLSKISAGSPIGNLPVDPTNTTSSGLFYAYNTNGNQFEVTANLESEKYKAQYGNAPQTTFFPEVISGGTPTVSALYNPSGLVGYWNLDEGSGTTAYDTSGGGHNISLSGVSYTGGKVGPYALNIPASIFLAAASTASLPVTTMSVSLWTKVATPGNYINYLEEAWTSNGAWTLFSDSSDNLYFGLSQGGTQYYATGCSSIFTPSAWHLLVGTYNGTTISSYVDGVLCGTATLSSETLANSSQMDISTPSSGGMVIDDMRLYSRALSAAEIQAMYRAEK